MENIKKRSTVRTRSKASLRKMPMAIKVAAIGLIGTVITAILGLIGAVMVALIQVLLPTLVATPVESLIPGLRFSDPARESEKHSAQIFKLWRNQHPELIQQYGAPRVGKFVSVHEQPFEHGSVLYNVTDGTSIWLFRKNDSVGTYKKLTNGENLTPNVGLPRVAESLFAQITKQMTEEKRKLYRTLVDSRVESPHADGIGIIGGIATLYISNEFYDELGPPQENEQLFPDIVYAAGEGYEVLAGLRHSVGPTSPTAPKSVYLLYQDGTYRRHVVFPQPSKE